MLLRVMKQGTFRECSASCVALLLQIHWGFAQGFSVVFIQQLRENTSTLHFSNEEISWIVSAFAIAIMFGSVFAGVFMEIYGRRTALQLSLLCSLVGWICTVAGNNLCMLCISRILNGMAAGISSTVIVYISEITSAKNRIILLSFSGPFLVGGTLICYVVGHYLFWKHVALVYVATSASSILASFFIPESPTWLQIRNEPARAQTSLKWLKPGVDPEITNTELRNVETLNISRTDVSDGGTMNYLRKIIDSRAWKPFLIIEAFFFLQQSSGYHVLLYYNIQFYELFNLPVDSFMPSTGYGIACIAALLIHSVVVRKVDRKTLTVVSASGMCITNSMAAAYQYWVTTQTETSFYWLPIICTWMNVSFGSLGVNSIPWQLIGELLPSKVRGFLSGFAYMTTFLYIFILVKIFPVFILPCLKIYELLAIFASVSAVTVLFGLFVLPETRGKTLAEIEELW